jgi:hypothetical protein
VTLLNIEPVKKPSKPSYYLCLRPINAQWFCFKHIKVYDNLYSSHTCRRFVLIASLLFISKVTIFPPHTSHWYSLKLPSRIQRSSFKRLSWQTYSLVLGINPMEIVHVFHVASGAAQRRILILWFEIWTKEHLIWDCITVQETSILICVSSCRI